jgi:hypothetical protein
MYQKALEGFNVRWTTLKLVRFWPAESVKVFSEASPST